jgi:hypothetical protein
VRETEDESARAAPLDANDLTVGAVHQPSWEDLSEAGKETWICLWAIEHLKAAGRTVPGELEDRFAAAASQFLDEFEGEQGEAPRWADESSGQR